MQAFQRLTLVVNEEQRTRNIKHKESDQFIYVHRRVERRHVNGKMGGLVEGVTGQKRQYCTCANGSGLNTFSSDFLLKNN